MGYFTLLFWMRGTTIDVQNRATIQRYLTEMLVPGIEIDITGHTGSQEQNPVCWSHEPHVEQHAKELRSVARAQVHVTRR